MKWEPRSPRRYTYEPIYEMGSSTPVSYIMIAEDPLEEEIERVLERERTRKRVQEIVAKFTKGKP